MFAAKETEHPPEQRRTPEDVRQRPRVFFLRFPGSMLLLLIPISAVVVWLLFLHQTAVSKGLSALSEAYRLERPLEARISGLTYAPSANLRGATQESVDQVSIDRAEAILLDAVFEDPNEASHHAVGRLYLARRQFDVAISQFDAALKADPNCAELHSDYGAALIERGRLYRDENAAERLEDYANGLEHLSKAIEFDDSLLEPLFNRAILSQQMMLPDQASEDCRLYLAKDPNSKWADEARLKLNQLEDEKKERLQARDALLPAFLTAHKNQNDEAAYQLLSRNTEAVTGQVVWWQLLMVYLDSSLRRDSERANESLAALTYAGKLMERKTGDRFIKDLAGFYGSLTSEHQASLYQAHEMIDRAHALLAKSEIDGAAALYEQAKERFDKAGDQLESEFSGFWVGYCRYRKSRFEESLSILSAVAEYCKARSYQWLFQFTMTMVANMHLESGQFSLSLAGYNESLEMSRRIDDEYNIQRNLTSLAHLFKNLGDRRNSLAFMQRSLEETGSYWPGSRQMYRNFDTAAGILNAFGLGVAAAEYENAALQQALAAKDPIFEHRSYTHLAAIHSKPNDYAKALSYAHRSYEVADAILQERSDPRSMGVSSMQFGHIYRQTGEHEKAIKYYDDAIRLFDGTDLFALLYETHKGRLLCYIAQGKDSIAEAELSTVLAFFEQHRSKIQEEKNRNSFFDLEQYVYDIAIDFEYSRKQNYAKAFEYSELSRARSLLDLMREGAEGRGQGSEQMIPSVFQPVMLAGIRKTMPAEVQILQYAVLDDKVLMWVVSNDRFEREEYKITSGGLTEKVLNFSRATSRASDSDDVALRQQAIDLYETLIGPVKSHLSKDKQICIVPDKALNYLPFNALVSPDTGNYLIRDYLFSFAPSSNTFLLSSDSARARSGARAERVVSVGDPDFNQKAFPYLQRLSESRREAEKVSDCYESASRLVGENATKAKLISEMPKADVIHIGSHYVVDEHNPMLSKLLLTSPVGGQVSDGVLPASELYNSKLPITRLVALSACSTGVERYYNGEGMIGMSRTFLAAGVPLVAASLWPVASVPTADLMVRFHHHRKRGNMSTAAALRQAQLDLLGDQNQIYSRPYYWASFIIVGGYADY